jgi:antitoxin (DNA-binding transcriptional repressor) of toxin-antitoxin stability system
MKKLSVRETRQSLTHLERLLAEEEDLIITRRGKAIARLVRIGSPRPIPSHGDLRASMRRIRRSSAELIRADRDGR